MYYFQTRIIYAALFYSSIKVRPFFIAVVFQFLRLLFKGRSSDMSGSDRMLKVDFEKDKVHPYIVDQIKTVEKDNFRRLLNWKRVIFSGRVGGIALSGLVLSIYGYTMYAVSRETFLDNLDDPSMDEDL